MGLFSLRSGSVAEKVINIVPMGWYSFDNSQACGTPHNNNTIKIKLALIKVLFLVHTPSVPLHSTLIAN